MIVILMGSKSDLEYSEAVVKVLREFDVNFKRHISSAHKTPEYLLKLLEDYEKKEKFLVYICIAGRSNALGGFVDAHSVFPVINSPPYSDKYQGMDILSSLRMPSGIASVTVTEPEQAALAAIKILASVKPELMLKISNYQKKYKDKIIKDDKELNK